ncbi:MAG: N-acetylmuramoyl-L-alanine amidase [Actinomycetota bacterium]|nr:N-acetylmuramoyl-L-alanine amidase [Actinomycetota bacterium]
MRHRIAGLTAATLLVSAPATGAAQASPTPVPGSPSPADAGAGTPSIAVHQVAVPEVPGVRAAVRSVGVAGPVVVATLLRRDIAPFRLVGLTWAPGSAGPDTRVQVRAHRNGSWSGWQQLDVDPAASASGADGAEALGAEVRDGTDPLWVDPSDGVEVRVLGNPATAPDDVTVTTIDPGTAPADAAIGQQPDPTYLQDDLAGLGTAGFGGTNPTAATTLTTAAGFTAVPRPEIVRRRAWGADPALSSPCDSPRYGTTVKAAVVHHTATTNDYSRTEAPAIVRGIYAYHTRSMGWCDIGYNFLVDRFGKVYEGRAGGINKPVRGAHAGYYNTNTVGVSLIGNFELAEPSKRIRGGLVRTLAWKLQSNYRAAHGRGLVNGTMIRNIVGHRDVMSTACPGRYMYARLPNIRKRVAAVMGGYDSPVFRRWVEKYGGRTGVLGWPFGGERAVDHGRGRATDFARGRIIWGPETGAHMLNGRILGRYLDEYGGLQGRLGYPTRDARASSRRGVRVAVFEEGRIYDTEGLTTVALWGDILSRYRREGGVESSIGLPLTHPRRIPGGRRAGFTKAWISYDRSTDTTAVRYR